MQNKKLYISNILTGIAVGLLASLSAFSMILYIRDGNSVFSLSLIAMISGALIGLLVAFIASKIR